MKLGEETLSLNGLEHYVLHVLPASDDLPLMIWVPDGPGETDTLLIYKAAPMLSRLFHTVSYDPRGSGRTYQNNPVLPESLEQLCEDLSALVEEMCNRYGKEQVVLFGRSFGSAVATTYLSAHPERILAYIAASQVICPDRAEQCRCESMEIMFNRLGQIKNVLFMSEIHSMTGGDYHLERVPFLKRIRVKLMQRGMGISVSSSKWMKQRKAMCLEAPNYREGDEEYDKKARKACEKLDLLKDYDFEKLNMDRFQKSFVQLYLSGTMDFENPYPMVRDAVIGPREKGQEQNPEYLIKGKRTMIFLPDARERIVVEDPVLFWAQVFKYLPESLKKGFKS